MTEPAGSPKSDVLQRIASRREQLEAKIRARRRGSHDDDAHDAGRSDGGGGGKGDVQVAVSRRTLTALQVEAEDAITQFRLRSDGAENARRAKDETVRAIRSKKTADEATNGSQRKGAIQFNLETLYQFHVPQELAAELAKQRDACRRLIEAKDKLLGEYRSQLRDKEEEYVRDLKLHAEQLDELLDEMHAQTRTMADAYARELHAIEEAYAQERRELLARCATEIDETMKTRAERETELRKQRDAKVLDAQGVLDAKYEEAAERYNRAKMEGQRDLHGLAQELEKCKADYLLNAERLNYNLQVLRERVKENKNAQSQHKRKLTRLQDVLSQLIVRYAETDKKFRQTNHDLTEGFRRVTAQYKELQRQFQHFEKADVEKFDNIWAMHEHDCLGLVKKCLQGDRVVFEEILGVTWVPPSLEFWPPRALGGAAGDGVAQTSTSESKEGMEAGAKVTGDDVVSEEALGDAGRAVLRLLYTQVPFLVEERAREARDAMLRSDSALALESGNGPVLTSLLQALGVTSTERLNALVGICAPTDADGRPVTIHPQDVVQALSVYLEEAQMKDSHAAAAAAAAAATTASATGGSADTMEAQLAEQRRAEKEYWHRVANALPATHLRVWEALEGALNKYLGQLQQRSVLIDETDALRAQNDELRGLLNQYLGSRINDELYSPPKLQVVVTPP